MSSHRVLLGNSAKFGGCLLSFPALCPLGICAGGVGWQEVAPVSMPRFIESLDIPSGREPVRIMESNFWLLPCGVQSNVLSVPQQHPRDLRTPFLPTAPF